MKTFLSLAAFFSLAAMNVATGVETKGASHRLSEFKVGRAITGPAVNLSQAKGKAVLIDAWGIQCPPCLKLLPEVEKLSRRYKDKLVVVGAHVQEGTDADIKAVVKEHRLSYGIVEGLDGPVEFDQLPFSFVFNASGTMIFAGNPEDRDFDRAVKKAVDSASSSTPKTSGWSLFKR